ncbi:MAG: hypothetical protein GY861_10285 [bacterium]|nr:hypothetical protein [bacterium]
MEPIKVGEYRGEIIQYKDGIGCCVWEAMCDDDGKEYPGGICIDYGVEDTDTIIELMNILKDTTPEVFIESPEMIAVDKKIEKLRGSLLYKMKDIGIRFTPFHWNFKIRGIFFTPYMHGPGFMGAKMTHGGIQIGPVTITW